MNEHRDADIQCLQQENDELKRRLRAHEAKFQQFEWVVSALEKSKELKRQILDAISDIVVYYDLDQNIAWANKAACESVNSQLDDIIGKKCYFLWRDRNSPCSNCPVCESLRNGRCAQSEVHTPEDKILEITSVPTLNEQGEVIGCVEVARDVTLFRQEEMALRKSKQLAEAADNAKTEFLANMSHELRSPMNGILGMMDLLMDSGLNPEQRDYAYTALLAGEGLLEIINDILAFSKLQAEDIHVVHDYFDLRTTLQTVSNTFREQAMRKGLGMVLRIDPKIPAQLWAAEGRIRQILFNLVGNAIKFTHRGSVAIDACLIRSSSQVKPLQLMLTVEDTGVGIHEESLDEIFEPFKQLADSRGAKHQGTGLGLGIVRRLANLLGGSVTVTSQLGAGTAFTVCLPVSE